MPGTFFSPAMSISLSKWPMLPTIALSFIRAMWSAVMMSQLPVAVTKTSARLHDVFEPPRPRNPSIAACSAQIGSISVTITRQPWPRSACAQPLPTSP